MRQHKCWSKRKEKGEYFMKIVLKTQGTLAIYEQIINQIKNEIVTGTLKANESLPSIRKLASELQISVITTKRAYEDLEKEGLIRSVPGKGFYVCESNRDYLKEKQYMTIETHFREIIAECKQAGMDAKDIQEMLKALLEE